MKTISPLAGQLVEYIESRIVSGEYGVGSRLPSIRRFAAKFRLSYGTAYRAVEKLCENGLLEQRGPSGVFVRARRSIGTGRSGRIAVLMEPYVGESGTGLCHTAFMGMLDAASKAGYQLLVQYVSGTNITPELIRRTAGTADGVILLNEYDSELGGYPQLPCPTVGMLVQNSWNGRISTVNLDPLEMACCAELYFRRARTFLRRVKIFASPKPVYLTRGRLFKRQWEERGGRAEFHVGLPTDGYEEDCGYFFTSDQLLQSASAAYLADTGEQLAARYAVLSVDGKQFLDPDFFRFPTIAADWQRMGECVLSEMLRLLNDPRALPRNINICGRLRLPQQE